MPRCVMWCGNPGTTPALKAWPRISKEAMSRFVNDDPFTARTIQALF